MTRFIVTVDGVQHGPHFDVWGDALDVVRQLNGGVVWIRRGHPRVEIERTTV